MGTCRLSDGFRIALTSGRSGQPHGAVHQWILAVNHLSGTPRFRRPALVCFCSILKPIILRSWRLVGRTGDAMLLHRDGRVINCDWGDRITRRWQSGAAVLRPSRPWKRAAE
jgi:hypothetical protein